MERIPCPDYGTVNLDAPPKGILHTTEGSFESALTVFGDRYAPHFLVGRDRRGKVRVVQLVELGRVAGALENHPGGVETNSVCRAQIEIADHSRTTLWLPDPQVTDALARLLAMLAVHADIPLKHPRVNRSPRRWPAASGWLGHADVPENTHWDPGSLRWTALLAAATGQLAELPADTNRRRLATLHDWIVERRRDGWSWPRVKATANWREFRRRGGQ